MLAHLTCRARRAESSCCLETCKYFQFDETCKCLNVLLNKFQWSLCYSIISSHFALNLMLCFFRSLGVLHPILRRGSCWMYRRSCLLLVAWSESLGMTWQKHSLRSSLIKKFVVSQLVCRRQSWWSVCASSSLIVCSSSFSLPLEGKSLHLIYFKMLERRMSGHEKCMRIKDNCVWLWDECHKLFQGIIIDINKWYFCINRMISFNNFMQ